MRRGDGFAVPSSHFFGVLVERGGFAAPLN
jgi:hypothetical protein